METLTVIFLGVSILLLYVAEKDTSYKALNLAAVFAFFLSMIVGLAVWFIILPAPFTCIIISILMVVNLFSYLLWLDSKRRF